MEPENTSFPSLPTIPPPREDTPAPRPSTPAPRPSTTPAPHPPPCKIPGFPSGVTLQQARAHICMLERHAPELIEYYKDAFRRQYPLAWLKRRGVWKWLGEVEGEEREKEGDEEEGRRKRVKLTERQPSVVGVMKGGGEEAEGS